ncbi:hypothetical protein Mcate_01652 [Meiothermus taiwanensis]|uniref:Uncharacterized protein n=1 Tax=Meiothermus taiwanensis TaxID=172827 RepID=A0A399E3H8_9DEIN|nr:hypothetical protein Mcate_01652 [Meiothermus taiwanensis]
MGLQRGHLVGFGQGVLQVVGGAVLPFLVVDDALVEGLPDALGDAAVLLALEEQGVDHHPAVVHRDVAQNTHLAGLGVYLHQGQVGPKGVVGVSEGKAGVALEARLQAGWQLAGAEGGGDHLLHGHGSVGAAHPPALLEQLDVLGGSLQEVGGNAGHLVTNYIGGLQHGRAPYREGAAAGGAHAVGNRQGIALHHAYALRRQAQPLGHDLHKGVLGALAVGRGAGEDHRAAVGVDAHAAGLPAIPRDLHVAAKPDAQQPALLAGLGLFCPELRVVAYLQQLLQHLAVGPGVVPGAGAGFVGEGPGDEVPAADLGGVEAQRPRAHVHQALEVVGGLGPPGPPVGPGGGGVGVDTHHLELHRRNLVGALQHQDGAGGVAQGGLEGIGPQVGHHPPAQPQDFSLGVEGHLQLGHLGPPVDGGPKAFAAPLQPAHASPQATGQVGHQNFLGVNVNFGPKGPAHVGGDHPYLVLGQSQPLGYCAAQVVGHLGARPYREGLADAVPAGQNPPGLQGAGGHPLLHHAGAHHRVSLGKGRGYLARSGLAGQGHVARELGVDGGSLLGLPYIGIGRERLVLHPDILGGVVGQGLGGRQHRHHRLPRVAHPLAGQEGVQSPLGIARHRGRGVQLGEVARGVNPHHAGALPGLGGVHRDQPGVRVGAAHQHQVQQVFGG